MHSIMTTSGRTRSPPIPKRESPPLFRFRSVLMLPGSSGFPSTKPHTNSTSEDAGTTSRRHNILSRPPNTYVLCSSMDMGSMGHHLGMGMVMDARRDRLRLSFIPR